MDKLMRTEMENQRFLRRQSGIGEPMKMRSSNLINTVTTYNEAVTDANQLGASTSMVQSVQDVEFYNSIASPANARQNSQIIDAGSNGRSNSQVIYGSDQGVANDNHIDNDDDDDLSSLSDRSDLS